MPLSFAPSIDAAAEFKPFLVEHVREDEKSSGNFIPAARLIVLPALRTSGLLAFLPDAEARLLLLLLTFLSPNGHIQATVPELAAGLHITEGEMRRRLERLVTLNWQGEPLAYSHSTETKMERYSPSPGLFAVQVNPPSPPMSEPPLENRAGRDAVIAYSRAHYANSRKVVERMIATQYGHDPAELGDSPEAVARRQLSGLGVPKETVNVLFEAHSLQEITDQLEWLPLRGAKSPARFVAAAISGRYAPPIGVKASSQAEEAHKAVSEPKAMLSEAVLSGGNLPLPSAAKSTDVEKGTHV